MGRSRSSAQSCPGSWSLCHSPLCLHSCCSCAPDGVGTRLEKACPLGVERVAPSPRPPASSPGELSFCPCSVPFAIQSCFSFASTAWRSRHPSPPAPPPSPAPPAGVSPRPSSSWLPCGARSGPWGWDPLRGSPPTLGGTLHPGAAPTVGGALVSHVKPHSWQYPLAHHLRSGHVL